MRVLFPFSYKFDMKAKTKKILKNLNKITASKTNPVPIPNTRVYLPETNKFWYNGNFLRILFGDNFLLL